MEIRSDFHLLLLYNKYVTYKSLHISRTYQNHIEKENAYGNSRIY